ncbi:hypothetical protein L873DRAFT_1793905 [Choiromyces venosus 120613-1]|uniref:Uncharacterized protein n=1 Tax=Choiromyces venosus 120613-1 TaxID=1336337 RepID=A0A3N4J8F6_9PEZI|nr:hypothetical protein L873DRAFT_1793905 [Choiromyces venosus 120613-1]
MSLDIHHGPSVLRLCTRSSRLQECISTSASIFCCLAAEQWEYGLLAYAATSLQVEAVVDGPHGSRLAVECVSDSDITVLVAGGERYRGPAAYCSRSAEKSPWR